MKFVPHVTHGPVPLLPVERLRLKKMGVPLSNFVNTSQLLFPAVCAWERPIQWGLLGNGPDSYKGTPFGGVGNCYECYVLHQIKAWGAVAHAGDNISFTTEQAVDLYSAITGYQFGNDATDQGTDPDTLFNYWQTTGIFDHKIAGRVAVDLSNPDLLKWAIFTFGGLNFNFNVPNYVMQVQPGGSLSLTSGADTTTEGGHATGFVGYGRQGFRLNMWGSTYTLNPDFIAQFGTLAMAAVSQDWVKQSGKAPSGLDLEGLLAAMAQV